MEKAPISFFAYKRPEHTLKSLESIAQNKGAENSEIFIFCDAPKRPEDREGVKQVREVARSKQWCGKVYVIERENNMGCANSIINGVTEICSKYGKTIVVEDDLVLTPYFLDYMNKALLVYENSPRVMQISGHMFPVKLTTKTDAIFLPFTTSWGWATWQRAWKHFDSYMLAYERLKSNQQLRRRFDLNDSYPYFKMLEDQLNHKIDSWAIRWYLSTFLLGGLTIYPIQSLVQNIGFDGSGTHCGELQINLNVAERNIMNFPKEILVSSKDYATLLKYFVQQKPSIISKIIKWVQ